MTKVIVPRRVGDIGLPTENTNFQSNLFSKNRDRLLKSLRYIPGLLEIARRLDRDTVYKLVLVPEGGKLYRDSAGNIKGVFYENGRILEHAKFRAVSPSLIKAASAIGSQILLVSIAMQLERIDKGMSRIQMDIHNDRISGIASGVRQFERAKMGQDTNDQSVSVKLAIQTLTSGIEKTVRSLKMQIEEAPDSNVGFLDNWNKNKAIEAREKFALAEESFKACLFGIKTLSECYAMINEPDVAASVLITGISDIKSSGIEMAAKKARLIPAESNRFPEELWDSFLRNESSLIQEINSCRWLSNNEFESIEIELKPMDLIGEIR